MDLSIDCSCESQLVSLINSSLLTINLFSNLIASQIFILNPPFLINSSLHSESIICVDPSLQTVRLEYPNRFSTGSLICNLPIAARAVFTLYCICRGSPEPFALGTVACQLFNHDRYLIRGKHKLRMWPTIFDTKMGLISECRLTG